MRIIALYVSSSMRPLEAIVRGGVENCGKEVEGSVLPAHAGCNKAHLIEQRGRDDDLHDALGNHVREQRVGALEVLAVQVIGRDDAAEDLPGLIVRV